MALIKCKECGKEISDQSKECVHCGCPIEEEIRCKECNALINPGEKTCSKCGCPIKNEVVHFNMKYLYIGGIILGVIIVIITIILLVSGKSVYGTYIQEGGAETVLILEKDNKCSMTANVQNRDYPATITNCHWSISGNNIDINYTMTVSSALLNYTRDASLSGTFKGDRIVMNEGAIYYKR